MFLLVVSALMAVTRTAGIPSTGSPRDFQAHAEPHIRTIPWTPNLITAQDDPADDGNSADNEIPVLHNYRDGLSSTLSPHPDLPPHVKKPIKLPVVNRPFQVSLLVVILTAAVFANGSVITNISRDSLKLRMVHFLLIRHVCIADCLGAILVLPVPMIAIVKGEWVYGDGVCSVVSTTTAALWTMHLLAVAFYRADRVLAVWLPTGRYPIFSVRTTNIGLVIVWVLAFSGSYGATITFGHTFQPALALCLPNVPVAFFIVVFSGYCTGLVALTTGYVLAFARRRRKKRKRKEKESRLYSELGDNAPFEPTPCDLIEDGEDDDGESTMSENKGRAKRALSDQFSASNKRAIFTPSAKMTHRRVWSESATAYCPSGLSSAVTRSHHAISNDSSSFHQTSSETNLHDYDRLTEDDSSVEFTPPKLTHSISFDGSSASQIHQPKALHSIRKGFLFAQSKSFDYTDVTKQMVKRNHQLLKHHFTAGSNNYETVIDGSTSSKLGGSSHSNENLAKEDPNQLYTYASANVINVDSKISPEVILPLYNWTMGKGAKEESIHSAEEVAETCQGISVEPKIKELQMVSETIKKKAPHLSPSISESQVIRKKENPPGVFQVELVEGKPMKRPKLRARTRVKHFKPQVKSTGPARRVIASYTVSVGHLLLYLPAMFVVGLQGAKLPPGVALICGLVVYCEFLVQPIALLLVSPRLRGEVIKTIRSLCCCQSR